MVQPLFTPAIETAAMSDLLVIVGFSDQDDQLLEEIAQRRPDRVTVLVEQPDRDWATAESDRARATRERLARLLGAIENRTGAAVLGTVGDREQLLGWRFDRVVGERAAATA
jgi:AmiR/NasT family two-component response regulator